MKPDKEHAVLDTTRLPALPEGWCWTTLETVAEIEGGITKDQKRPRSPTTRRLPYLRVANVQRGFLDLAEMKTILADEDEITSLRLRPGDILFTEGGDRDKLGRGWVWNGEIEECIHQNHIFRARPCLGVVDPKFISYHGNHFGQQWFVKTGKQTTNLASINKGVLRRFPVPVAPLPEQRRIVAKIEELFSDLDAGVAALNRVKAKLKRYRAAVLKAAVEGKLTAGWRAKQVDAASRRVSQQPFQQDTAATAEITRRDAASTLASDAFPPPPGPSYFRKDEEIVNLAGNLPHWRQEHVTYYVTFRLADSLPRAMLRQWVAERDAWLTRHPKPWDSPTRDEYHRRFTARLEEWLDAGYGSCVLAQPERPRGRRRCVAAL